MGVLPGMAGIAGFINSEAIVMPSGITLPSGIVMENKGSGTNQVWTFTGVVEDDLIVVFGASDGDPWKNPAGYTEIVDFTARVNFGVSHKRMGAIPDTGVTVLAMSGTKQSVYGIVVLRGVDTVTPLDVTLTTATGGGGDPECPPITTVTDDAMILAIGALDDKNVTSCTLAGYSDVTFEAAGGGNNVTASLMIGTLIKTVAGLETPPPFVTDQADAWNAVTIAFRPKSVGPPPAPITLSYVDFDYTNEGAAGPLTVEVGDLLIGLTGQYSGAGYVAVGSLPAGWTQITGGTDTWSSGGMDPEFDRTAGYICYKIADGTSEDFEYLAGSLQHDSNAIIAFRPSRPIVAVTIVDSDWQGEANGNVPDISINASGLIADVGGLLMCGVTSDQSVTNPTVTSSDSLTIDTQSSGHVSGRESIFAFHLHDTVTALTDPTTVWDSNGVDGVGMAFAMKLE